MTFFSKSKSLQEKATKTPWSDRFGKIEYAIEHDGKETNLTLASCHIYVFDGIKHEPINDIFNAAYIVHCVNTHAKLCELLERAIQGMGGGLDTCDCNMCELRKAIESELNKL